MLIENARLPLSKAQANLSVADFIPEHFQDFSSHDQ
jgi:hypothetical protein